jgi:hypothetical protein
LVLAFAFATAPLTGAFAADEADKATARDLAKKGIAAGQSGDCTTAIDLLVRAESLYHAPIHLQHLARCYTKEGRLVEAAETWRTLTLETLPPNSPPIFREAVEEAKVELPKLEPRLAHLTIVVKGSYPDLVVKVDGKVVPGAALGVSRPADPGKRVVHAEAPTYKPVDLPVELPEGGADTVTVELEAAPPPPPPKPSASVVPSASAPIVDTGSSGPWKTIGIVTAGVGAAALIGAGITGLMARSAYSDMESKCPNKTCTSASQKADLSDKVDSKVRLTNILLLVGGVLVVAGATTFFLAPSPKKTATVSLEIVPMAGGGHVGLTGSF